MRVIVLLLVFSSLLACGQPPELKDTRAGDTANIEYADFVPIDRVLLEQREGDQRAIETEEELETRLAALRSRAARLRAASVE